MMRASKFEWIAVAVVVWATLGLSSVCLGQNIVFGQDDPPAKEKANQGEEDSEKEAEAEEKEQEAQSDAESREPQQASAEEAKERAEADGGAADQAARSAEVSEPAPPIRPRFELSVPSVRHLLDEVRRSNSRFIVTTISRMLTEMTSDNVEGVTADDAAELLGTLRDWPDSGLSVATYAPDTLGRARWRVGVDWPVAKVRNRIDALLESDAGVDLFAGVTIQPLPAEEPSDDSESSAAADEAPGESADAPEPGFAVHVGEEAFAFVRADGASASVIASHADLPRLADPFRGPAKDSEETSPLVACRLNLKGTERDSGAGVFGSFSIVTEADYTAFVDESSNWVESLELKWPPLAGMGAKALLRRVKQTFFVPSEAFGAVVLRPPGAGGMLDGMAGFGPQMVMDSSGGFSMVGEMKPGPLAQFGGSDVCFAVLPGTGFLPVPDMVAQVRVRKPDEFIEEVRGQVESANKRMIELELEEVWREVTVRGRPVFIGESQGGYPGMLMPFTMRRVVFTTRERDARDRSRDFVVMALTSTSPERFVERWLALPRNRGRHLPDEKKINGQGWLNWKTAYRFVQPYLNIGLSASARGALLPDQTDIAEQLDDAVVRLSVKYAGMRVDHSGPVPFGPIAVPVMLGVAAAENRSGDTDLARERLASRRLKTFYHHCRLFKKDYGRWPAELAELDGYVDFAGHPELLRLQVSPKRQWAKALEGLVFDGSDDDDKKGDDEDDESDEDDLESVVTIDDDLFVIDWGQDDWRLGVAPGTLDHLEVLYIDAKGRIHRKEKKPSAATAASK